jgi:hypothetical protein
MRMLAGREEREERDGWKRGENGCERRENVALYGLSEEGQFRIISVMIRRAREEKPRRTTVD